MTKSERDIIKDRFLQKKEALDKEGLEVSSNKELLGEVVRERIEKGLETLPQQVKGRPQQLAPAVPSISPLGENRDEREARNEEELQMLVQVALKDNIPQAVLTARKIGNDFLLDRLHDVLVDKYYQELKNKGVI